MFTLPANATDDELREGVIRWFNLLACGDIKAAQEFLAIEPGSISVEEFVKRVKKLTSGGKITAAQAVEWEMDVEEFPIDGPIDIVSRWVPGPATTGKFPGFVGDIVHTIPVDGEWSDFDASFFIRSRDGGLSLQLRDIVIPNA